MTCPRCNQQIGEGDRYCQWCGQPVAAPAAADSPGVGDEAQGHSPSVSSEPAAGNGELRSLRTDLDSVVSEVGRLSLRLESLESRFGAAGAVRAPGTASARPAAA